MSDTLEDPKVDLSSYPEHGFKIGISHHNQTLGKHRPRFAFNPEVAKILSRGLAWPRIHIDGNFVNGMRIWCSEDKEGMAPTASLTGSWSVTLPVRRVRGREDAVTSREVPFSWERDETGPVLVVPRVPDVLLPESVIDKLPNSQVDPETRIERAEKRLKQEMARVFAEAAEVTVPDDIERIIEQEIEALPPEPEPIEPPTPTIVDLKDALQMVNELVDQLGDSVVLSIDETGHVRAKRRIVQFIDL
jgi:hypothetical protein